MRRALAIVPGAVLETSVSFGTSAQGAAHEDLDVLRSQAATSLDAKTSGKSRTIALALAPQRNFDPIQRATLEPIKAFAHVLWSATVPKHVLVRGLEAARAAIQVQIVYGRSCKVHSALSLPPYPGLGSLGLSPSSRSFPTGSCYELLHLENMCPRVLLACCGHAVRHWTNTYSDF